MLLKANGEGFILKNVYSDYRFGHWGYSWIKLKADYF